MSGYAGDGDLGPDEPAVGGADLAFGGLGHHCAVDAGRGELRERLLDAEAGEFLIGDGSHDDLTVDPGERRVSAGDEGGSQVPSSTSTLRPTLRPHRAM